MACMVSASNQTYWGLLVNGLDDKLLVIEGDVSDFTPRKSNLWCESGLGEYTEKAMTLREEINIM